MRGGIQVKLENKVRSGGEHPFLHHTADEPDVMPEQPYKGLSKAASATDGAEAIALEVAKLVETDPEIAHTLGEYRVLVGFEFKMGNIAMIRCKSGPEWEEKLDAEDMAKQVEFAPKIARRLVNFVRRCIDASKESRARRMSRGLDPDQQ